LVLELSAQYEEKGKQQYWKRWETGQEQCPMLEFMDKTGDLSTAVEDHREQ